MRAKMYFESDSYFQYYVSISMNTCMLVLILGGLSKTTLFRNNRDFLIGHLGHLILDFLSYLDTRGTKTCPSASFG